MALPHFDQAIPFDDLERQIFGTYPFVERGCILHGPSCSEYEYFVSEVKFGVDERPIWVKLNSVGMAVLLKADLRE